MSLLSRASAQPSAGPILPRLLAALFLRRDFYAAVAADSRAWRPATAVVGLAAIVQHSVPPVSAVDVLFATWFGSWVLIVLILLGILQWLTFTAVLYPTTRLIARRPVPYARLLRCVGFAQAPALLGLTVFLVGDPLALWIPRLIWLWLLAATVVAVRAAAEVSARRAMAIGFLAFAFYVLLDLATRS